jgi:dienelactone hydrolase
MRYIRAREGRIRGDPDRRRARAALRERFGAPARLFAESDPYEPDENVEAFERGLREAGRSVTIHRDAGTGHWFAEHSRDAWRPEAADLAFQRTVAFLREHLGRQGRRR